MWLASKLPLVPYATGSSSIKSIVGLVSGLGFPFSWFRCDQIGKPFAFILDQLDIPGGLFGSSLSFPNHQDICDQRPGVPWKGRRSQGRNRSEVSSRSFMGAPNDFLRLVSKKCWGYPVFEIMSFFFCEKFIKMWNGQIWHNSIANLLKLKGQSSPTNDGHWGDQKMTGDEESQSLGAWGRAYSNSFNSQHWV